MRGGEILRLGTGLSDRDDVVVGRQHVLGEPAVGGAEADQLPIAAQLLIALVALPAGSVAPPVRIDDDEIPFAQVNVLRYTAAERGDGSRYFVAGSKRQVHG